MKKMIYLALFVLSFSVHAGVEVHTFKDTEQEKRYLTLIDELRCLVCQNQNLADSNAELAKDLRNEVFSMLQQGKSNKEITDFMVNRYGDFVLYEPPLKPTTVLLWAGPVIILIIGFIIVIRIVRQRKSTAATSNEINMSEDEKQKIKKMLDDEGDV